MWALARRRRLFDQSRGIPNEGARHLLGLDNRTSMVCFWQIQLKNSKSGGAKFSARRENARKVGLDLPPRSISESHAARARIWRPPPKITTAPVRPENFPIRTGKGVFQQNPHDSDPRWPPTSCPLNAQLPAYVADRDRRRGRGMGAAARLVCRITLS